MKEKYVNPFTDFGFKKIFGNEANKDLLIDFLNNLLAGTEVIKTLQFKNPEKLGLTKLDRKSIFDLYCENEAGEKFIIELQQSKQQFFKDRSLYYATFPIQEQAERGDWNFKLKAVYLVAILDFVFDDDKDSPEYRHEIKLLNKDNFKVFSDKLTFIYLEMPKFNKKGSELKTTFDKWMYVLKSLPNFQDRPKILQEKIFKKLFDIAELANFNRAEYNSYEGSLKDYRDLKNMVDTAIYEGMEKGIKKGMAKGRAEGREKGRAEGRVEGIEQIAKNLKEDGVAINKISKLTGLSKSDVEKL